MFYCRSGGLRREIRIIFTRLLLHDVMRRRRVDGADGWKRRNCPVMAVIFFSLKAHSRTHDDGAEIYQRRNERNGFYFRESHFVISPCGDVILHAGHVTGKRAKRRLHIVRVFADNSAAYYIAASYVTRADKIHCNDVKKSLFRAIIADSDFGMHKTRYVLLQCSRVAMQMGSLGAEIISRLYVTACGKQSP